MDVSNLYLQAAIGNSLAEQKKVDERPGKPRPISLALFQTIGQKQRAGKAKGRQREGKLQQY